MENRTSLKLKPEAIKPDLNVLVDWYRDGRLYNPGVIIKKLRKNWLVKMRTGQGDYQNVSVPYKHMTVNSGFTKDGRMLMANKEDKQYWGSKDHIDYVMSLLVVPENKTIKHRSVGLLND